MGCCGTGKGQPLGIGQLPEQSAALPRTGLSHPGALLAASHAIFVLAMSLQAYARKLWHCEEMDGTIVLRLRGKPTAPARRRTGALRMRMRMTLP